jgi:hypothetical protein
VRSPHVAIQSPTPPHQRPIQGPTQVILWIA